MTQKIHFITYGDRKFKRSKDRITREAQETGWFDSIKTYAPENLDKSFWENFGDVLKQRRGGGYWIWKLNIIQQRLRDISDGDILVYIDSGCIINKLGGDRFHEYINQLNESDEGIISFKMKYIEREWTVKEILEHFKIDINSDIATSGQYVGGILIMKKCEKLKDTLDLYYNTLLHDRQFATDFYNNNNQHSFFRDNRHDQSVFSIIRKIKGSLIIDDETDFGIKSKGEKRCGSELSKRYPFWATRLRM